MEFESEKHGDHLVLKVIGRMDAITSPAFQKECQKFLDAGEKSLIIDFSALEFISSAGLRTILATAKRLKAGDAGMRFCNLTGMVQDVFSVSGFASMFTISETLEVALKDAES